MALDIIDMGYAFIMLDISLSKVSFECVKSHAAAAASRLSASRDLLLAALKDELSRD